MAGFAKPICLYQLRIFTQLLLGSRTITVVGTHPIPSNAGASAFQRLPTSSSPPPYFCTNLTHEISFPSHGIHASIGNMTCTSINLKNVTMTTATLAIGSLCCLCHQTFVWRGSQGSEEVSKYTIISG